jgi:hypothetical protein
MAQHRDLDAVDAGCLKHALSGRRRDRFAVNRGRGSLRGRLRAAPVLEMLLLRYDDAAQPERDSEFMRWVPQYGASRPEAPPTAARFAADADPHPFIRVDLNKWS